MSAITQTEVDKHLKRFGITYTDFKAYATKTINDFKATREFRDEFMNAATQVFETELAYNAAAMLSYESVVGITKLNLLDVPGVWELADEKDKRWTRIAFFRQVVFFTKNGNLYEKITGQSINTATYNFQTDTSRNLIDVDVLGQYTKTALKNAQWQDYELVDSMEDAQIYAQNKAGVTRFFGDVEEAAKAIKGGI